IYADKSFDAELVFLRVKANSFIWYDTDNDGKFDVLLYDEGTNGSIDSAYKVSADGDLTPDAAQRLGRAVRGSLFSDPALAARVRRIAATVFPTAFIESGGSSSVRLPDPIGNTGRGSVSDLDGDGRRDAVLMSSPFSSRF